MIHAYDPAATSIPSFGVNDIWSLLFKNLRGPQNQSRLSRDFSGACFESHSESNKLLQNNDRNFQYSVSRD